MINELKIELVDKSVQLLTNKTDDVSMTVDEIRTLAMQIDALSKGADDFELNFLCD